MSEMEDDLSDYEKLRLKNVLDNKRILEELMGDLKASACFSQKVPIPVKHRVYKKRSVESLETTRRNPLRNARSTYGAPSLRSKTRRDSLSSMSSSSTSSSDANRLCVRFGFFQKQNGHRDSCGSDSSSDREDDEYEQVKVRHIKRTTVDERTAEEITDEDLDMVAVSVMDKKYDSIYGTSCHQCRQKTNDMKTICRSGHCWGVRGQFCGPCLRNRYGEDAKVALKDDNWSCPPCRGVCNCSLCRKRKGKSCTGILIHTARDQGFNSVYDYLNSLNQPKTKANKKKDDSDDNDDNDSGSGDDNNNKTQEDVTSVDKCDNKQVVSSGRRREKNKTEDDQDQNQAVVCEDKDRENQNETSVETNSDSMDSGSAESETESSSGNGKLSVLPEEDLDFQSCDRDIGNSCKLDTSPVMEREKRNRRRNTLHVDFICFTKCKRKSGSMLNKDRKRLDKPSPESKDELKDVTENAVSDNEESVRNCKLDMSPVMEREKRSRRRNTLHVDFVDFTKSKRKSGTTSDNGRQLDNNFPEPTDELNDVIKNTASSPESMDRTENTVSGVIEKEKRSRKRKSLDPDFIDFSKGKTESNTTKTSSLKLKNDALESNKGRQPNQILPSAELSVHKAEEILSPKRRRKSFDEDELKLLEVPYKHGWQREVVFRNDSSTTCDIYYRPPQGRKLRSTVELVKHLVMTNSELNLENFSFARTVLLSSPFEIVRHANDPKTSSKNAAVLPKKGVKKAN